MCQIIPLDSFRSAISHQHRAAVIAGRGLKIGDMVRVHDTGREHPVFQVTSSGSPVVLIEARMRALQPGDWERV